MVVRRLAQRALCARHARRAGRGRWGRVVLTLLVVVPLGGCWLQPDADGANTRWNPWERRITPTNVASLQTVWSREMASSGVAKPLINGGRVYVSRFDYFAPTADILSLDLATGGTVWQRTLSLPGAEVAYPQDPGAFVEGELWTSWIGDVPGSDECPEGSVRIGRDGDIVPIDTPGPPISVAVQSGTYVAQTFFDGCPSGPVGSQVLVVRDARTRATLWTAAAGNFGGMAVRDGLIVTGQGAYLLAGCGAPTCGPLWRPAEPTTTEPTIIGPGDDFFIHQGGFAVPNGQVVALSKADGQVTWEAPYQGSYARMAADDDHLFVSESTGSRLLALDVDGCGQAICSPVWSAAGGAGAPIVGGDVVYVPATDGTIKAYDADGCGAAVCQPLASLAVPNAQHMAVAEGHLVVASGTTTSGRYQLTVLAPTAPSATG